MSNSTASSSTASLNGPVSLRVTDAQTSVENGRKFTKYKVSVNYNGQEWEIWRRYKEFHNLNEKVSEDPLKFLGNERECSLIFSFDVFVPIWNYPVVVFSVIRLNLISFSNVNGALMNMFN